MVTFNCEVCNDTVPKKNTEKHYYRCPDAYYTCIDCSVTFEDGVSYKKHTECITEDEKYQKALYKGKKKQTTNDATPSNNNNNKVKKNNVKKEKVVEEKKNVSTKKKYQFDKGDNLYKILKKIDDKGKKKDLLKSLIVDNEGRLVIKD